MSDECRCSEIRELNRDINKLSNALDQIRKIDVCKRTMDDAVVQLKYYQNASYESDNKLEVISAFSKLYESYNPEIKQAMDEIKGKRDSLRHRKSKYEKEDSAYHEAERRRREKSVAQK